jgi:hypothetical protein
VLSFSDQVKLVNPAPEDDWDWPIDFVPMRDEAIWQMTTWDFRHMTVTPSIDASASGHWHGFITNGEIR